MFRIVSLIFFIFLVPLSAKARTLSEILDGIYRNTLGLDEALVELRELIPLTPFADLDGRRIIFHQKLGEGSYGQVYRVEYDGKFYAFKVFKLLVSQGLAGAAGELLLEAKALVACRGAKYVIPILGIVCPAPGVRAGILMPLMSQSLDSFLTEKKNAGEKLDPAYCVRLFYGLVRGVQELKERGLVHCDVKPPNVLLTLTGDPVIADLGSVNVPLSHEVCTLEYRPPEYILQGPYDAATMMFSLGCVFFKCLTGKHLFPAKSEIGHLLEIFFLSGSPSASRWPKACERRHYSSEFPKWPDQRLSKLNQEMDSLFARLLCHLLALDPRERPDPAMLLNLLLAMSREGHQQALGIIDGLQVFDVPTDGDCAFSAVSVAMGKGIGHINRADFIQALRQARDAGQLHAGTPLGETILLAIGNAVPVGTPVEAVFDVWLDMLARGMWLSHADLAVVALLYGFTLHIHVPQLEIQIINPGQDQEAHIFHLGPACASLSNPSSSDNWALNHYAAGLTPPLANAPSQDFFLEGTLVPNFEEVLAEGVSATPGDLGSPGVGASLLGLDTGAMTVLPPPGESDAPAGIVDMPPFGFGASSITAPFGLGLGLGLGLVLSGNAFPRG